MLFATQGILLIILQWVTFHLEIKPIMPELEEPELSCALREDFLEVVGLKVNLKE